MIRTIVIKLRMPLNTPFVLLFLLLNKTYVAFADDLDLGPEKISLTVPQLSEEESRSNHMPTHLRCDACLAVVHQIDASFSKFKERKYKSPSESDIIEILENTCNNAFENYGVKQVDGVNRLSGPGLETEQVMGMTQMGGRWPHRLQEMCHYYVGEIGESEVFNIFKEGKGKLVNFFCERKGMYGHCSHLKFSKIEL